MNKPSIISLLFSITLLGISNVRLQAEEAATPAAATNAPAVAPVAPAAPAAAPAKKKKLSRVKKNKKSSTTSVQTQKSAAPQKKMSSLQAWLNKMKKKINTSETKHNKLVAVAAVRGDETSDVPPLYWKGKETEQKIELPELKEFDDAINLALNGDNAGAKTKLEAFITNYPNSPMKADAQETLNQISAEPVPVP